jgi:carboxypeptidase PM20D1
MGYVLLALLVALIGVLVIRAIRFTPKAGPEVDLEQEVFDKEAAISRLAELIKCKTVSYRDPKLEDDGEFKKLLSKLPQLYPNVFKTCEYNELPDRALLFRWKGEEEGEPAVLMAHYDVVPVDESGWEKPAFEAIIEDGVLWGRGSLDTKVTFGGILSAAEHLI